MTLSALAFVGKYGSNFPMLDEWTEIVPAMTGNQPITLAWLWHQHNEHRLFLAKLVLMTGYKLTGNDFRAGMFCSVLALGLLAFLMIRTAQQLRGRASYADAFFPLALLTWGHHETLLVSISHHFVSAALLAGIILVLMVRKHEPAALGTAVLAGACLALLPWCGAEGSALVPPFALWLGTWADRCWSSGQPHGKRNSLVMLALIGAALSLMVFYFIDYRTPVNQAPSPGPWASCRTSIQFLSLAIGAAGGQLWPWSGLLVLGLLLSTAIVLLHARRRQVQNRFCASGLLLFLAAIVALALGMGWGRAGAGAEAGLSPRYTVLTVPALCGVYFAWGICSPAPVARLVQTTLCLTIAALLFVNVPLARAYGEENLRLAERFERDMRERKPIPWLAQQYTTEGSKVASLELVLVHALRQLKRAGIAPFESLPDGPPP
jgi:hypothetical protein